ncbi:hypothetical protein [Rhizobium sp. AC44/96]|uniref:hypothetical protein n=1 Tax=Rhizobium sp. AC44/96 TaxID=1841654 RepID=UPI00114792B2|nr:hypothetical protein [Rhizobium sp. AC44/96]
MTDEQYKALRRLILEQSIEIKALALEVRTLKQILETTEVLVVEDERVTSDELEELIKTRQSRGPRIDS